MIGPSLHLAPSGSKWQLSIAGGPAFHVKLRTAVAVHL